MKTNTILIIGILATIMILGAAIALAQNASENKYDTENQECTIDMMENNPENCPEEMMQSGECEKMMGGAKDCSVMMGESTPSGNTEVGYEDHCGDMGSGMGSTIGSKGLGLKTMM